MKAACNYARRAMSLAGPWAFYDEWTHQVKFLYMVRGHQEKFTQAWAQTQAWTTPAATTTASATTTGEESSGGAAPQPAAKGQPGKRKVVDKEKGAKQAKTGSEMAKALALAKKVKVDYNTALSQANMVLDNIAKDSKWSWAAHDFIVGDLRKAKVGLEAAVAKSDFAKDAMVANQIGDLKINRKPAEFQTDLARLNTMMEPLIKKLSSECRMLLAQQLARQSAA